MFGFEQPWALLLLPLPWLIRWYLTPVKQNDMLALRVPFFQRLTSARVHGDHQPILNDTTRIVSIAIWGLLTLAAMGPQWLGEPIETLHQGRNVFLALDLSGSMQIPDMDWQNKPVDRLTVVKYVAKQFVKNRRGDRLGLILFGSSAYLQTPLTFDLTTVNYMIDDATIGLAGGETAIGDAIGLAIKRFHKTPKSSRVLILLTDGANNAGVLGPIKAAELAKDSGVKIYTIGLGADQLIIRSLLGSQIVNPSEDLDEGTLKKIAEITGGQFFRAKDTEALESIYQQINHLEPSVQQSSRYRPSTPYFQWPLGLALLLSMGLLLRRWQPRGLQHG